jgi:hypothetical protein
MNPTCGSCRFFKRRETGKIMGNCHSRAPVVMFSGMAVDIQGQQIRNPMTGQFMANFDTFFPALPDTEWCGDHQPRLVKDLDLSALKPEELKGDA